MRKIIIVLCLILLFVCSSCSADSTDSLSIEKIIFPQLAMELDIEGVQSQWDIDEAKVNQLPSELKLYYTKQGKQLEAYQTDSLLKIFGMTDAKKNVNNEYYFTEYSKGDASIKIYKNGNFIYSRGNASDDEFTISDNQVKEMAAKFMEETHLLPNDFYMGGVGYTTVGIAGEGDQEWITAKEVGFFHKIDGYEVYGKSDILVEYDSRGIRSVMAAFSQFDDDQMLPVKGIEHAKNEILHDDAWIQLGETGLDKKIMEIKMNDIAIIYYDQGYNPDQKMVQPCYVFSGIATDNEGNQHDFSSIVPCFER